MTRTNTLLNGPVQTGKTWITRTLLAEYPDAAGAAKKGAGKIVLTVSLEPGWLDTMSDCICDMGMHYHYVPPLDVDWEDLEAMVRQVGAAVDVTKVRDPNTRSYDQVLQTYSTLKAFHCDRCGKEFPSVSKLGDDHAVVMDGLTGLSRNCMNATVGLQPSKSWPEFDAAGQMAENLLRKCVSIEPSFILLGHIDREPDPLGGYKYIMHTIGNKLAYRITKDMFSEIIFTKRDDRNKFTWSTQEPHMDLKARRLPFSDNITPGFVQILED